MSFGCNVPEKRTATCQQASTNAPLTVVGSGVLQRKCACGTHTGGGECAACAGEKQTLQRKAANDHEPTEVPPIVYEVLGSPGQPLDRETRAFFEPRFGRDFSDVRVHTDAKAAESARAVNALAYAVGRDLAFDLGQYSPLLGGGRQLLAHELVHVVQESRRTGLSVSETKRNESEALQAEQRVLTAGAVPPPIPAFPPRWNTATRTAHETASSGSLALQRKVRDTKVSCGTTGLHGGVPGGAISGADAINAIKTADARATKIGDDAVTRLSAKLTTIGTPAYAPDPALDAALVTRFGLHFVNPAERSRIVTLERELRAVRGLLSSEIFYVCRDPECSADDWALSYPGEHTIRLCSGFWNGGGTPNFQASSLLHEAVHLWWNQVDDRGHPPLHNAHCFEQFAIDLAGATGEIPPAFAGACVVP